MFRFVDDFFGGQQNEAFSPSHMQLWVLSFLNPFNSGVSPMEQVRLHLKRFEWPSSNRNLRRAYIPPLAKVDISISKNGNIGW